MQCPHLERGASDMRDLYGEEGVAPVRFFHICTDGTNNGIVHLSDADYLMDNKICAVNAHKFGVRITCFAHMSTHSHQVVWTDSYETAKQYAEAWKHSYAMYCSHQHGIRSPFEGVECTVKPIFDSLYLKRCISYTLLNPVTAGIVRSPEEYRWSSFSAYFNPIDDGIVEVASLSVRQTREILHTRNDLAGTSLRLTADGEVSLKSFVDYKFVENLFGSQTAFFKSLALTNCAAEEQLYVNHLARYSDTDILAEIISLSTKKYGKSEFRTLTKSEKLSIVPLLIRKTSATPKRLARLMRLQPAEITAILGQ